MPTIWIFFTVLHLLSALLGLVVLARLYGYIKKYRFSETKYTLLFRVIHLRWITRFYILMVFSWIGLSYLFITLK